MSADNVRPFRRPARSLTMTIAQTGSRDRRSLDAQIAAQASPACDVRLVKGDRRRRFLIREGQSVSEWYCQVWFGETQHRGERVLGVVPAQRLYAQYQREIEALTADGWAVITHKQE
jgi:hypothetical protein